MKLGTYIYELLLLHDCVVVPNFGGFIGNDAAAQINTTKNRFSPPTKQVSFNRNLTKNDGLLIQKIATDKHIDSSKAQKELAGVIEELSAELKFNRSLSIDSIGTLFYDKNNKLQFEPDEHQNLSLAQFGLTSFRVNKIEKKKIATVIPINNPILVESKKEPVVIPIAQVKTAVSNEKPWKRIAVAALILPFVLYAIWFSTNVSALQQNNFQFANLNPFSSPICTTYKERNRMVTAIEKPTSIDFKLDKKAATIELSLFDKSEKQYDANKKIIVSLIKAKPTKISSTYVDTSNNGIYKFHIIGGCFSKYKNAERLAEKLRKKGFNAAIIDKNKGLFRVSFQSFVSKKDAEDMLAVVKSEHNKSAWLLVR